MSVSRPQQGAVAAGVSHALMLHDVTVRDLWEALTILEPPIAAGAARRRTDADLARLITAVEAFVAARADTEEAVRLTAGVFRCAGAVAAAARALAPGHDRRGAAGAHAHSHGAPPAAGGPAGPRCRRSSAVDGAAYPRLQEGLRDRGNRPRSPR